jgi:GTP:adenosylcobinamide-phosphate guanylyltransferase
MADFTGLVLAGRRGPADDPLVAVRAARHRALVDVEGVPMLVRVVRTLRAARSVGRIIVSIDDQAAVRAVPELAALEEEGELALRASRESPSRSVLDTLESLGAGEKLLVSTADHALLTPEMVDHFAGESESSDADVNVALVRASLLRAHFPQSKRTYLWLRDDGYSGANLFAFRSAEARRVAAFWVRAERFRKRPLRMISVFGPVALLLFALRRLDLDAALERVSRVVEARVTAVPLPFPEAAIDVDHPRDLALATEILIQRTRSPSAENRPVAGS